MSANREGKIPKQNLNYSSRNENQTYNNVNNPSQVAEFFIRSPVALPPVVTPRCPDDDRGGGAATVVVGRLTDIESVGGGVSLLSVGRFAAKLIFPLVTLRVLVTSQLFMKANTHIGFLTAKLCCTAGPIGGISVNVTFVATGHATLEDTFSTISAGASGPWSKPLVIATRILSPEGGITT